MTIPAIPTPAADVRVLQSVPSYASAQAIVDQLSDAGFPVERIRIVGTGLRTVEQVTGRLTTGRAAGRGALSGLWFGLMVGILFGLFAPGFGFLWILLISLLMGALFGAIAGAVAHAATAGRRDFSSIQGLEASSYDILVEAAHIGEAERLLGGGAPVAPAQR
ncbi:general stress protein [Micrococcus sp.]|uniref:general stress protein n=1 Tax=Micrococcus sp. TaxID=1271 RepID=UPI002A90D94E|nr:general stress protein [Micrococcus sp.]MDY6055478.1 general stress protein [Micrococcus sp.]